MSLSLPGLLKYYYEYVFQLECYALSTILAKLSMISKGSLNFLVEIKDNLKCLLILQIISIVFYLNQVYSARHQFLHMLIIHRNRLSQPSTSNFDSVTILDCFGELATSVITSRNVMKMSCAKSGHIQSNTFMSGSTRGHLKIPLISLKK